MMKYMSFLLLLLVTACQKPAQHTELSCCVPPATQTTQHTGVSATPGGTSLYQLPGIWQTAQGGELSLDQLQGRVQVFSMVFTHCGYACPKMVDNLKEVQAELPRNVRDRVGFVLVSFDTVRDSTARLRDFALQKGLDQQWTLLKGTDAEVRTLSLLLDVQYARLRNGDFSHANVIVVLDESGRIATRIEGLDLDTRSLAGVIAGVVR